MKRNTERLSSQQFEAVVVGGGIHGATIFHQLTKIGMRVALIEKGDFGQATSANSLKILHGGLRYLQHLNFKRMRESIKSRWHYMEIAPHLIKPMPCLMATRGTGIQSKPVMAIALKLFDLISFDRNANSPPANRVGKGRILSKKECFKIAPGIDPQGLTGAALWYDDLILNTERMTLSFIKDGCDQYQGVAANYVKAEELLKEGDQIVGVQATDIVSGDSHFIKANLVINAAGPWAGEIASPGKASSTPEDLAKAVNIVVNRPLFAPYGFGLSGSSNFVDKDAVIKRKNRLFFFAPWKNTTIIGTTYRYYRDNNDALRVTDEDIQELLDEVNQIYPIAKLKKSDVTFSHCGLVPAHKGINYDHNTTPQLIKHSRIIDHEELDGTKGLFTVEGVKYTTAPEIARQLVSSMNKKGINAEKLPETSNVEQNTSPVYSDNELTALNKQYPEIYENYGKESPALFSLMEATEDGNKRLLEEPTVTKAEVLYAVREEMAVKLVDVVLRRTCAATFSCPDRKSLTTIAEVMAEELSWNQEKVQSEVDSVITHFEQTLGISVTEKEPV